jgi:hypothetical protein
MASARALSDRLRTAFAELECVAHAKALDDCANAANGVGAREQRSGTEETDEMRGGFSIDTEMGLKDEMSWIIPTSRCRRST